MAATLPLYLSLTLSLSPSLHLLLDDFLDLLSTVGNVVDLLRSGSWNNHHLLNTRSVTPAPLLTTTCSSILGHFTILGPTYNCAIPQKEPPSVNTLMYHKGIISRLQDLKQLNCHVRKEAQQVC